MIAGREPINTAATCENIASALQNQIRSVVAFPRGGGYISQLQGTVCSPQQLIGTSPRISADSSCEMAGTDSSRATADRHYSRVPLGLCMNQNIMV